MKIRPIHPIQGRARLWRLPRVALLLSTVATLALALCTSALAGSQGSQSAQGNQGPSNGQDQGNQGPSAGQGWWNQGSQGASAVEQLVAPAESRSYLTANPFSASSLLTNVDIYAQEPNHWSGTYNDAVELGVISQELADDGLQLGQMAYSFPAFVPGHVALTVGSQQIASSALAPMQYSGATGPAGVSGQLYYGGKGTAGTLAAGAGKIIVLSGGALAAGIEAAVAAGAKAVLVVRSSFADYGEWEDVNSRDGSGTVPVLFVGKVTGKSVVSAAEAQENANVVLQAQTGTGVDRDIWGVLPGHDPSRRIFIGTPASSMVPAALERGAGDAADLALARYYSKLPLSQRPATLVFLFTTGHEVGFLGLQALIKGEGSWFTGAEAYIHIGASLGTPTATEAENGTVTVTQTPGGSLRYSENPVLESIFPSAFASAGVTLPSGPAHIATAGEQADAYTSGVPTIGFSSGSLWFHTEADLPDIVDPTLLTEETEGLRNTISAIAAEPAGALKAANSVAEADAATINVNTRFPTNPVLGAAGVGGPEPTIVPNWPWPFWPFSQGGFQGH